MRVAGILLPELIICMSFLRMSAPSGQLKLLVFFTVMSTLEEVRDLIGLVFSGSILPSRKDVVHFAFGV